MRQPAYDRTVSNREIVLNTVFYLIKAGAQKQLQSPSKSTIYLATSILVREKGRMALCRARVCRPLQC